MHLGGISGRGDASWTRGSQRKFAELSTLVLGVWAETQRVEAREPGPSLPSEVLCVCTALVGK